MPGDFVDGGAGLVEQAYREAVGVSLSNVADFLQDLLGCRFMAYVASCNRAEKVASLR